MLYESRVCAVCQSTIEPGSVFCGKCGTRYGEPAPPQMQRTASETPPTPSVCKECGATIAPAQLFCGRCGARVPLTESVGTQTQTADPVLQPLAQRIAESLVQPVAQPTPQPVAQSIIQPAAQPAVQQVLQPMAQLQQVGYVPPVINVTVNNAITQQANQTQAAPAPIIVVAQAGPNLMVRAIYFVFVGWWLGAIVASIAWLLNMTIIGLPLGLYMLNRLPSVITLRSQGQSVKVVGQTVSVGVEQQPFVVRAVWFVFVGSWLSLVWIIAAYACVMSIILLPVAFWMFGRVGAVTTLYKSQ